MGWLATLVPQTNMPETPAYTEGETLKAKSEGFQEDHMGVVQQGGTPFSAWEPPMKVVNSLHLGEKALQRWGLFLSLLPIKQSPNSSKIPAGPTHPMA